MVRSIFYQGVQTTRGSIILPGGPEFVIIPTRGSAGRFFFTQNLPFLDPLVTTGFAGGTFLTQNQPFLDPLVVLSRTIFFYQSLGVKSVFAIGSWCS